MTTTTAFSLQAAEAYVLAHGSPRQKSTWKAAFGCGPVEVLIFDLEAHVAENGHWHGLAADEPAGGLASTVAALRTLAAVSLGEDIFEVGRRTIERLAALEADGWDAPGPWPGMGEAEARRAYHTAAIGMLAPQVTGSAETEEALRLGEAARAWLLDHPEAVAAAGPATWWLAVGCGLEAPAEALLGWLATPRPASDLAWIHEACRLGRLPADHPLRRRAWEGLAGSQGADGAWAGGSDAGMPADAVEATIFATRAVVRP